MQGWQEAGISPRKLALEKSRRLDRLVESDEAAEMGEGMLHSGTYAQSRMEGETGAWTDGRTDAIAYNAYKSYGPNVTMSGVPASVTRLDFGRSCEEKTSRGDPNAWKAPIRDMSSQCASSARPASRSEDMAIPLKQRALSYQLSSDGRGPGGVPKMKDLRQSSDSQIGQYGKGIREQKDRRIPWGKAFERNLSEQIMERQISERNLS
jgi:hypothetical protein